MQIVKLQMLLKTPIFLVYFDDVTIKMNYCFSLSFFIIKNRKKIIFIYTMRHNSFLLCF